jgi:hypothetical protein
MNVRPNARRIAGVQRDSERLTGVFERGADFILALARDTNLLARDDGHTALIAASVSPPGGFVWL